MRRLAASIAVFLSLCLSTPSFALNTWGTDMSDWWYANGQDGWAVNVAHQTDTLFIAMFVYGPDRKATWYSAALTSLGGTNDFTFTGTIYETTGPFFGMPVFDPSTVTRRLVGTATMTFTSVAGAQLSYTIDNVPVSKLLERFTFKNSNLAGNYSGANVGTVSGCASGNGPFSDLGDFVIAHSGTNVSMSATYSGGLRCTYSGTYAQRGRMGHVSNGTFTCSTGASGTFLAFEMESGYNGFLARYTANAGGSCTESGQFGALRK